MLQNTNSLPINRALWWSGWVALAIALITVGFSVLVYAANFPGFSIFQTYLSDIGDTPGWPQVIFNSGTLIAAPLRFFVVLLIVLRLRAFQGIQRMVEVSTLVLAFFSCLGTILMTAVPFSLGPAIHKSGIGLYFLGVILLQIVIGMTEWRIKKLPRLLPGMGFFVVACFVVFMGLFMMLQNGIVSRSTPVFWEWMCFFSSLAWMLCHSIYLGKNTED